MKYFAALPEMINVQLNTNRPNVIRARRQLRAVSMGLSANVLVVFGHCGVLAEPERGCCRNSWKVGTGWADPGEIDVSQEVANADVSADRAYRGDGD
jgi:hypothetical protein